jgi:hypothetical protein
MLGSKVDILMILIPNVSTKSMSRFGVGVVEFGRWRTNWIKGSSIPCSTQSHSVEYGLLPLLVVQSTND